MGGDSSSTQSSTSQLAPYAPAAGYMNGILGQLGNMAGGAGSLNAGQSDGLNKIMALAKGSPDYSGSINGGMYGLLNGGGANNNNGAIGGALGALNNGVVGQTASGANIGGNSALKAQLDTVAADTSNGINSSFAAAGRDMSPGNSQAVARGVAQAQAPIIAAQYNTDTGNALNAANTLYGAANNTYGILNNNQANANTNFMNGVNGVGTAFNAEATAPTAEMQAASQQFGIPMQQLQSLLGSIAPVAAQFGTQSGTTTGTQQMSGAQQFATIANGAANTGKFLWG